MATTGDTKPTSLVPRLVSFYREHGDELAYRAWWLICPELVVIAEKRAGCWTVATHATVDDAEHALGCDVDLNPALHMTAHDVLAVEAGAAVPSPASAARSTGDVA